MAFGRILNLRPGEGRRVGWIASIGIAYAAAVTIGDDVAQSIFVARIGAENLPHIFVFKALLDIVAAAAYLPLTRGRSPGAVWRVAIAIYMTTVLSARLLTGSDTSFAAYALYIGHECAWTILTIHWGVFILDAFDASQARRLFPLLFTAARLGGVIGGATLRTLVGPVGVDNMMAVAAGFALLAGGLSALGRSRAGPRATMREVIEAGDHAEVDDEAIDAQTEEQQTDDRSTWKRWTDTLDSKLVRTIAYSTACMVVVRYGLKLVSLDQIRESFHGDETMIAEFIGAFSAFGNIASAVIGIFIVPRVLTYLGVGFANVLYALGTVAAYAVVLVSPSLLAAANARFVDQQLKDALKTPLSALFYGAEPPAARSPARAFIFGAAIPPATMFTAITFGAIGYFSDDLSLVSVEGLCFAVLFVLACLAQNQAWRNRLRELLTYKLRLHGKDADPRVIDQVRTDLEPYRDEAIAADLDAIARGLAAKKDRLRAVAEEVLSETIPRRVAHRIARRSRDTTD